MGIAEADVAKVRAATDLAALIGERTALRREGRRLVGLCPFHTEKSASFSVNPEEGLYYCFGCQARGDAITFVRETEKCGFVEAVERLAARAGISIEVTDDPVQRAERQQRQRLAEIMTKAVEWYHAQLLDTASPAARPARDYLRSRGYDGETARRFRLGYAPSGPDALTRALRAPTGLLVEAGLARSGSSGRPTDVFRDRVIFPIFDSGGQPVALGGRVLPEGLRHDGAGSGQRHDPGPKYRNSAESPLYQKRRILYGLNWAKVEIGRTDEAVVCEGYTDVIGCFRAGVERAVATCGTSLTEDHIKVLANFAKRVVLAFDADAAGQNAAARLYEWERRHDIELKIAALPAGSDPGELAERDPAALAGAIAEARPFLAFVVERALASADLSNPEGRARAARAALRALAEHPDALVRDQYLLHVASRTRNDAERLRAELEALRARGPADTARESAPYPAGRRPPGRPGSPGHGPGSRPLRGAGSSPAGPAGSAPPGGAGAPPGSSAPGSAAGPPGQAGTNRPAPPGRPVSDDAPPEPYDEPPDDEGGDFPEEFPDGLPEGTRGAAPRSQPGAGPDARSEQDRDESGPAGRPGGLATTSRSGRPASRSRPSTYDSPRPGRHVLLLAIHRPAELAPLFESGVLDRLLFFDETQRAAFDALAEADELHDAIAASGPEIAELITELAVSEPPPEDEPADQTVISLARHATERALALAEAEARLAEHDRDPRQYARANTSTAWLQDLLRLLNDPIAAGDGALEAARRLVASLRQQAVEEG